MADKELLDYIKKVKALGHDNQTIVEVLRENGYDDGTIDNAFRESNKKLDIALWFLIGFVVLGVLLVGSVLARSILGWIQAPRIDPCENVSISYHLLEGKPALCIYSDNSNLQFIVENDGIEPLEGLLVSIVGKKGSYEKRYDAVISPEEVFPLLVAYDEQTYGEISEVITYPLYKGKCKKHGILKQDIEMC